MWVMAADREDKVSRKDRTELGAEERRLLALEDIADELHLIRGYFADVSLWVAHIGRNMPVGRGRP
jgi:hypothetical protein